MTLKVEILAELDRLIELGTTLDSSIESTPLSRASIFPEWQFRAFAIGAIACIKRVAGEQSEYFSRLRLSQMAGDLSSPRGNPSAIPSLVGSLTALRCVVDGDFLGNLDAKLRANIHDDFLAQSKTLLEAGYYVAGMVLIGSVLEDHLRKLCLIRGLTWNGKGGLSEFTQLLKSGLTQPVWRQMQVVADLRNSAAHSPADPITEQQAEQAHAFVAQIIATHPA